MTVKVARRVTRRVTRKVTVVMSSIDSSAVATTNLVLARSVNDSHNVRIASRECGLNRS